MERSEEEYSKDKKELISDFNEAKFQIYRLNLAWIGCRSLSENGLFDKWKWKLDAIWRELSPDAREKDGYKKKYTEWTTEGIKDEKTYIFKVNKLNDNIANAANRNEKYKALQEKEIFLRCLQDDVGKGSRRSSSDEDDIDE